MNEALTAPRGKEQEPDGRPRPPAGVHTRKATELGEELDSSL